MCGIAGQFNFNNCKERFNHYKENTFDKNINNNLEKKLYKKINKCTEQSRKIFYKMQQSLSRRGPDQDGMYIEENVALIHARLAVVDIENGIQPMSFKRGNEEYILVYNGELYNTEEIRCKLKNKGHCFKGHSDTEVLLHAYVEYKEKCVELFNGIFAFAIWEKHNNRLFIARDRIGVKPFFYAHKEDKFIFASEIKTLLVHPEIESKIGLEGLAEIMFIGPGRTPGQGVFMNVEELLPGECGYVYYDGRIKKNIYWRLEDKPHTDSFEQTVEKVRYLVIDAIERQLVSDVKVCTFLSGGLDSSIISAVADRYYTKKGLTLDTVSVGYVDNEKYFKASKFQPNSDEQYINIMSDYLKGRNNLIELNTPELVRGLYKAVDARDVPGMADVDSSLLLFCKEIKKIATVGLSGECADEIFGGYPWYRDKEIREKYGFPWAQSTEYRASFLRGNVCKKIKPYDYVDERYKKTLQETSVLEYRNAEERRMKEMINLNFRWFMQTLLDRKDRMSMYSSLEVRVPFCDYRIAEYMYSVPWEYKDYHNTEKGLLRKAMEGILPEEILWRKKSPYPKTHNPEYLEAVRNELKNIIEDKDAPIHEFIIKEKLEELLNVDNKTPWYGQLMTTPQTIAYFLQFNYWLKKYDIKVLI